MSKRRSSSWATEPEQPANKTRKTQTEFTNCENALAYLLMLFPHEQFCGRVPRVVMKHFVYSLIKDRTKVDRELDSLQSAGKLRFFKLGNEEESLAVILTEDVKNLVQKRCAESKTIDKYLRKVLEEVRDVSVEKAALAKLGLDDNDIKSLVNAGLLTVRAASTYWFSFPGAGEYMKAYTKGRKAVINALKKAKYKQIHRDELESRVMKKAAPLGVIYHIHDIIGADIVSRMETTSGEVLCLED